MKNSLKISEIFSIGLLLFAIFFGAGNMIFPPALGQAAGTNTWIAILGFIIADVGLSLLAIIAVAFSDGDCNKLANSVHPKFSKLFIISIYMAMGPFCVIPRTGAVSYEMSIMPLLPQSFQYEWIIRILFTFIFFTITYFLALNPSKLVNRIGKILTPALLFMIGVVTIASIISPIGSFSAPIEEYARTPFLKGFLDGYLTLDAVGALIVAIIVINSIKELGIKDPKSIAKNTIYSGIIASVSLLVVYFALAYLGASSISLGKAKDGVIILTNIMNHLFGTYGILLLGLIIMLACLTTSVGLASSFGNYFSELSSKFSYKRIVAIVCLFSFILSNLGLSLILKITEPILLILYPLTIILILVSFIDKLIKSNPNVYVFSMICAFIVSLLHVVENLGLTISHIHKIMHMIPLYDVGMGWVIPSIIGGIIGFFIPYKNGKKLNTEQL